MRRVLSTQCLRFQRQRMERSTHQTAWRPCLVVNREGREMEAEGLGSCREVGFIFAVLGKKHL